MHVRNINLHQISRNSINSFLSLCHQFYRPTIIRKHTLVILNKEICIKLLETAFDCRCYFFFWTFLFSIIVMRMLVNSQENRSVSMLLSTFTLCSDRTHTADAILKTTSLARRYDISSFATHGPLSATVFMVLYLNSK